MKRYHIPTAQYEVFSNPEEAAAYIEKNNRYPIVVKADGLEMCIRDRLYPTIEREIFFGDARKRNGGNRMHGLLFCRLAEMSHAVPVSVF